MTTVLSGGMLALKQETTTSDNPSTRPDKRGPLGEDKERGLCEEGKPNQHVQDLTDLQREHQQHLSLALSVCLRDCQMCKTCKQKFNNCSVKFSARQTGPSSSVHHSQ